MPISDLNAWYWESLGRRFNYAKHILAAMGHDGKIDTDEARRRSPLSKPFPAEARKDARLRIYAGIHDGHIGCVPVSHSINFYNRIAGELKYGTDSLDEIYRRAETDPELVSKDLMLSILEKRLCPENLDSDESLLGRRFICRVKLFYETFFPHRRNGLRAVSGGFLFTLPNFQPSVDVTSLYNHILFIPYV